MTSDYKKDGYDLQDHQDSDVVIQLTDSPLYRLSASLMEFIQGTLDSLDLGRAMEDAYDDIERTLEEEMPRILDESDRKSLMEMLYNIQDGIAEIDEIINDKNLIDHIENPQELEIIHREITGLVHSYVVSRNKVALQEKSMVEEKKLIEDIESRLKQEDVETKNFLKIKNAVGSYLNGEIDKDEYDSIFEQMASSIREIRFKYEESYLSEKEWTLEVYLGDKLLTEGIELWNEALSILEDKEAHPDKSLLEGAVEMAFKANRKLVMVQILSKVIDEKVFF